MSEIKKFVDILNQEEGLKQIPQSVFVEYLNLNKTNISDLSAYNEELKEIEILANEIRISDNEEITKAFIIGQLEALRLLSLQSKSQIDDKNNFQMKINNSSLREVILALGKENKLMSHAELANKLNKSVSAFSNLMNRNLYYYEFINREKSAYDSREVFYSLNQQGQKAFHEIADTREKVRKTNRASKI